MIKYKDIKDLISCHYIVIAKRINPFTNKIKEYVVGHESKDEKAREIFENAEVLKIKQKASGYKQTVTAVLLNIPSKYLCEPERKSSTCILVKGEI